MLHIAGKEAEKIQRVLRHEKTGFLERGINQKVIYCVHIMGCQQLTYKNNNFLQVAYKKNGQTQKKNALDYFSGGMAMPNRNIDGDYRYGYQGAYSEKDPETGLNAFKLRMYDSRINRWLSPDPYGQFASPYMAMGNNWINFVDPDGGLCQDAQGNSIPCPDGYGAFNGIDDIGVFDGGEFQGYGLDEVFISNQSSLSIKVDGRELNPNNYALSNINFPENIANLYSNLVEKVGNDNFQFKITGGDRYIGEDGKVYSSTNNSLIPKAGTRSPHIVSNGARAVDLRIKYLNSSKIIPLGTVQSALNGTELILDPNALPSHYPDQHYHLQLPNLKKYGGKY